MLSSTDIESDVDSNTCKRTKQYDIQSHPKLVTSAPIKSQIVIVSSKEMPLSSDELETIDVGVEGSENPFGDMNLNEISIEIVDDLPG